MSEQLAPIEAWNSGVGRRLLMQLGRGEVNVTSTFARLDLQKWEQSWLRRVLRWNFSTKRRAKRTQWRMVRGLAEEFDELRKRQARRRTEIPVDQKTFRGKRKHLDLLARSLSAPERDNEWNAWRKGHPHTRPDLRRADLRGTSLSDVHLDGADLRGVNLSNCDLTNVRLHHANLRAAQIYNAKLTYADLRHCDLSGAWLHNTDLTYANLQFARLGGALLTSSNLNMADLRGTDLRGLYFWGTSYWGVRLDESTKQSGIKIGMGDFDRIELLMDKARPDAAFPKPDFSVEIDDLRVADFMWQISDYPERVADMINAASLRLVLLLGRFSGNRKALLDRIGNTLGEMGYVPMVFDFIPDAARLAQKLREQKRTEATWSNTAGR